MLRTPKVILFCDHNESNLLEQTLNRHVILKPVHTNSELRTLLERGHFDAVFCGWSFQAGGSVTTWNEVMEVVAESHPELPVIILSSLAESEQWGEALEAGAFDLLIPPYEERSVLAMLEHAAVSREATSRYLERMLAQA
jgi:DNA-binding NtrC family response regulator